MKIDEHNCPQGAEESYLTAMPGSPKIVARIDLKDFNRRVTRPIKKKESRFFEPPRETKIGPKNRIFRAIGGKIDCVQLLA